MWWIPMAAAAELTECPMVEEGSDLVPPTCTVFGWGPSRDHGPTVRGLPEPFRSWLGPEPHRLDLVEAEVADRWDEAPPVIDALDPEDVAWQAEVWPVRRTIWGDERIRWQIALQPVGEAPCTPPAHDAAGFLDPVAEGATLRFPAVHGCDVVLRPVGDLVEVSSCDTRFLARRDAPTAWDRYYDAGAAWVEGRIDDLGLPLGPQRGQIVRDGQFLSCRVAFFHGDERHPGMLCGDWWFVDDAPPVEMVSHNACELTAIFAPGVID